MCDLDSTEPGVTMTAVKAFALLACLAAAVPAAATPVTYEYTSTSTDGGPGAGITYTLVIDDVTGAATFTVDGTTAATEVWQAGWFTFKFVGGNTPSDITSLTSPDGTGPWSIADVNENTNIKVLQGGTYNRLLVGSSTGFYVTSLAQGLPADDPTQGVCVTALYCSSDLPATFTFTVLGLPEGWSPDTISFQVGYYDGQTQKTKWITNQLSEVLDETGLPPEAVPDGGATVGLLGLAMLGLWYMTKRRTV